MFTYSTVVIILSSIALQASYYSFKKGNPVLYKGLLLVALAFGFSFVIMQYMGWQEMVEVLGISMGRNPSGDFIYVISGVHAAHVLGGIAVLLVAIIQAFALKYKVTERRILRFDMTLIYWHFVGVLWVYLVLFFTFQR
jgi:cytochrome c oxidase subunit 3